MTEMTALQNCSGRSTLFSAPFPPSLSLSYLSGDSEGQGQEIINWTCRQKIGTYNPLENNHGRGNIFIRPSDNRGS